MIRCLIERGLFVAPCEFDTQEQLNRFRELGKEDCDKQNEEMKELVASRNLSDEAYLHCCFQYRESFEKTKEEQEWDELDRHGAAPFSIDVTTVYPESVLKNALGDFIDKQARWDVSKAGNSSDVRTMRRLLHRAEQVRKNLPRVQSDELSDTDKRNKRIYELKHNTKLTRSNIANTIKDEFGIIMTPQAVGQAAREYSEKHGIDPPPKGKPGRRPGSTPKLHDE